MHHILKTLAVILLAVGISNSLFAQQTESYREPNRQYYQALEWMEVGQYESARRNFLDFLAVNRDENSELNVNATYYYAYCSMELFHKDAEYLMQQFVLNHPESLWHNKAMLDLANYNFNRRDYDDALYWFNKTDVNDLSLSEQEEVQFKKGFSAFELEDYKQAKASFYELKDGDSEYAGPSNYYYGHIAYTEGNFQTALISLEKASEDPNFQPVVPYYITQIYHFQGRYEELISYATPMMEDEETIRKEEIAHLLGDAYYQKEEYASAIPFLTYYTDQVRNYSPEDAYQLAYALYRNKEYRLAIDYYVKAAKSENTELVQIATYQMADSYLKLDEKKFAQNAFKIAAQTGGDPEITEDAFFNYAKLAYELSYDPFHEAIKAFEQYLEQYPNSNRKDEAYEFLLKVYIATRNYPAAMSAINRMKTPNAYHKTKYQECAYNYAVEFMRKGEDEEAMKYFLESMKYPENPKLVAQAKYWIGDLLYREAEYLAAIEAYEDFLSHPSAYQTDFYNLANYNIGYCASKMQNYPVALRSFRSYVSSKNVDEKRKNDAYLRIGDINLVGKQYALAIENYGKAKGSTNDNGDYAMFQMAQAYGYQENHQKKIEILNTLILEYPQSSLVAVAQFELGDSYFTINDLNNALPAFNIVIEEYPQSPYRKKALLKRGLVQYRAGDYDAAILSFETIVADYGVDSESNEAIATLKNIYLDLGKVDEYSAWLSTIPDYVVSEGEIDSLSYQSAENLVAAGDCDSAIPAFEKYLRTYPNGLFALNSNYYLADCAYRKNDYEKALTGFQYVNSRPVSQFTEPALLGAATILYGQKNYQDALLNYQKLEEVATFATNKLEAQIGVMRCAYKVGDYDLALLASEKVLDNENTPEKIAREAILTEAKIKFTNGEYEMAKADFAILAKQHNSVAGAESKYRLAEIAFIQDSLEVSETNIFELVNDFSAFTFWKVKAFILLSDIYVEREDFFQARATLQSVIDNVSDAGLVTLAEQKMVELDEAENALIIMGDTIASPDTLDYEESYEELIEENNNAKNKDKK